MKKNQIKNKKIISLCSFLLVTITVIVSIFSRGFTKRLVNMAINRDDSKSMKKTKKRLSGSKEIKVISEMQKASADTLKATDLEEIRIVTKDNTRLIGHLYRIKGAKRTILAFHGWRSSWDMDFGVISSFWHNNNCNVLYVEQRGQGMSGGNYMGFGVTERHDCLEWVEWLNNNGFNKLPIYLAGISMGATTVLMASSLDFPDNVFGIMADCGFTSPYEIWRHIMHRNLHLPYNGVYERIVEDMCKKKMQIDTMNYSTLDALKESNLPILFIHGTEDHFVPIEMTYQNYKTCISKKYLLVVPGAEHGMSYVYNKDGYEQATIDFWKACE